MWYHGGPSGIHGSIRPASETGARTAYDYGLSMDTSHVRRDRVFLTDCYEAALMFACVWPEPMIYVVIPLGDLEPDPDYDGSPGMRSVQTVRADIVRAIRPRASAIKVARNALVPS